MQTDAFAEALGMLAVSARSMPPSYRGAGLRHPIIVNEDRVLGYVLPGVGIEMAAPLHAFGIRRGTLPFVIDQPLLSRVQARWPSSQWASIGVAASIASMLSWDVGASWPLMAGALASYDNFIAAVGSGRRDFVHWIPLNDDMVSGARLAWYAPWIYNSQEPFVFTASLGATAPDQDRIGNMFRMVSNPSSGESAALTSVTVFWQTSGPIRYSVLALVDMLYECGGVSDGTVAPQTLGTAALTRYTDGVGVIASTAWYESGGGDNRTVGLTYTNQAGTHSRTANSTLSTQSCGRAFLGPTYQRYPHFDLQSTDYGIRSVQTFDLVSANAGGFGGVFLHRPLAFVLNGGFRDLMPTNFLGRMDPVPLQKTSDNKLGCIVPLAMADFLGLDIVRLELSATVMFN